MQASRRGQKEECLDSSACLQSLPPFLSSTLYLHHLDQATVPEKCVLTCAVWTYLSCDAESHLNELTASESRHPLPSTAPRYLIANMRSVSASEMHACLVACWVCRSIQISFRIGCSALDSRQGTSRGPLGRPGRSRRRHRAVPRSSGPHFKRFDFKPNQAQQAQRGGRGGWHGC